MWKLAKQYFKLVGKPTKHKVVSDEVICAFGRIGSMFACDDFGYVPDIITCAKGMTSGYAPDPVVQLAPPLVAGPAEFDQIEQILRGADGGVGPALSLWLEQVVADVGCVSGRGDGRVQLGSGC